MLSLSVQESSILAEYFESNVEVTKQALPQLTKVVFGHHCFMPFTAIPLRATSYYPAISHCPLSPSGVPFDLTPPWVPTLRHRRIIWMSQYMYNAKWEFASSAKLGQWEEYVSALSQRKYKTKYKSVLPNNYHKQHIWPKTDQEDKWTL